MVRVEIAVTGAQGYTYTGFETPKTVHMARDTDGASDVSTPAYQ